MSETEVGVWPTCETSTKLLVSKFKIAKCSKCERTSSTVADEVTASDVNFNNECNFCSCLDGKMYCTNRLCLSDYMIETDRQVYGPEFTGQFPL